MNLSPRYQSLVEEVISRLPSGWCDVPTAGRIPKHRKYVTWVESDERPEHPTGLAATTPKADSPYRNTVSNHIVTLFTCSLSRCPDDVVRWTIAHELGHVVTSHLLLWLQRHGQTDDDRLEDWADGLAMGWGFNKEWQAFKAWTEQQMESD